LGEYMFGGQVTPERIEAFMSRRKGVRVKARAVYSGEGRYTGVAR